MLDKSSVRTFLVPEGSISVLLKRAAAGFILRFGGLGILSNKRPDSSYWPSGHCLRLRLRLVKSSVVYKESNTKIDIADVFSKWYNIIGKGVIKGEMLLEIQF